MGTEEGLRKVADDIMDELVRELEAEVSELREQIPRWIPVSEQLPDDNVNVIAFLPGGREPGGVREMGREGESWYDGDGYTELTPTHWMPLPAPPTDVAEQT